MTLNPINLIILKSMKLKMKKAFIIILMKNELMVRYNNQRDKILRKTQEYSKKK